MKLVYLIHSLYNAGGTERVLTEKVNLLCREFGYDITIITARQDGRTPYFQLDERIKIENIGINFYAFGKRCRYMKKLEQKLSEIRPDICISLSNYEIYGLASLKDGSIKVAEYHFSHDRWFLEKGYRSIKARIRTRRLERSAKKMARFVVLSDADTAIWRKIVPQTIRIYNPSPFENVQAPLEGKIVIAMGRLCKQKNFPMLVKSWGKVHLAHPDWELDIYGEGEDEQSLRRMIRNSGLDECIKLKGTTKNPKEILLDSSIFVMSSIYEGFGMVLAEAQSLGIPLISTDCRYGPAEIIENGSNGFLVPVGDADTMAEKICCLIENPVLRKEMGAKGLKDSARFKKELIVAQWDELFRSLVP